MQNAVHTVRFFADERRVKQQLGSPEARLSHRNLSAIRQHVASLRGSVVQLLVLAGIGGYITQLFLDGANNLKLSRGFEDVAFAAEQQLKVAGHIASGNVHTRNCVLDRKALADRHSMGHTIARVQDNTRGTTSSIES
eukprot:TRINITY_DN11712_c0_g1_i4.p4 TRINITY_DN11712_c0_g1~~TRINITY_DN11712_c0_g1_i4.p4  ORF type:complete len:138 (-),score=12.54 TRINITY_DN11712_c0_g1_i4:582-995(-)